MLTHIHVRDFALVTELELDFQPGLTVLTGETGAGKSILAGALGVALGNRGDSQIVRHGSRRAEISAIMDISHNRAARQWLKQHELDNEQECHLRRVISAEGRSRAYINGRPVTRQQLSELGKLLIDIHGQHEHQSLLRRDVQLQLLDDYATHPALLHAVADSYQQVQNLQQEYRKLETETTEQGGHLDLLRYQTEELENLAPGENELPSLEQEQQRLANMDTLMRTLQGSLTALDEDEQSVTTTVAHLLADLQPLQQADSELDNLTTMLSGALIQLQETASELRQHLSHLTPDPARLQTVEQRLTALYDVARKHHIRPEQLPQLCQELSQRLTTLEQADGRKQQLLEAIHTAEEHYRVQAHKLRASRKKAAALMAEQITTHMQQLGMPGGRLTIELSPLAADYCSLSGQDKAAFLVTANPGQPLSPLEKVASGGELSRISLAIHVITARRGGIPTLIFDEVDVGIGGRIAGIVGQELHKLARHRQVLCITHLPQVAAQGDHHLQVSKASSAEGTTTRIQSLDKKQRSEEIARMLGGIEITAQTRAHAEEMISGSQQEA